jgi:hypothetical protein
MKGFKVLCQLLSTVVIPACLTWSVTALPVVGVTRTGPLNIYKGSASYYSTTFTLTSSPAPTTNIDVYVYFGGDGNGFCTNCMAVTSNSCNNLYDDFKVTGAGVTPFLIVPNLYEVEIPAGQTSVVVTATALNTASACGDPDTPNLLVNIPGTTDYTENQYTVSATAPSASAYIWATNYAPNVTLNVSASTSPPYLYKTTETTVTFTLTASQPFPAQRNVVFLVGGDGTDDSEGDPCFATYPTDFSTTGLGTVPINNGFSINFNEGDTTKTFTVTAKNNSENCEVLGFQPLYVTVVNWGTTYGYGPGTSGQLIGRIYTSL